jgi:light-regulated signal transduction histidine kinase (bacteriophytochrome)
MLTGQGSEAVAVAAMKQGANYYLVKGQLTAQTLINAVINALEEQKLQAQKAELVSDLQKAITLHEAIEQQLRDRTLELERINSMLSRSTHLLEDRNQELDDFSHIASHDLQAPLRGIANLAEWLASDIEGKLPIENQQQLKLIQSRVSQMNVLISGLLQYARVGRENIDTNPVNLSQLLAEVIDLLAPPIELQIQFPVYLP